MDLWWLLAMITVASAPFPPRWLVAELVKPQSGVVLDESAGAKINKFSGLGHLPKRGT
jgi:hypothetical protein